MISKKNINNNFWYIFISILLLLLIILICFLIYIIINNNKNNNKCEKNDNFIIIKEDKKELPIYPTELPKYNNTEYQQIGILTSDQTDKEPIILPLFSRKINNHNDRFNYYTATDKNNMIRLPIKFNNLDCEDENGCREIYDNDTLNIEIYKDRIFTATIYKKDVPRYFSEKW